ncbi:putative secreted protein [Vulgatibacter incomptus]|uniref:Putative secreted protein n=2 Tax=Vulgatibacter incomptus TaxID=1391653 RepID=A0A0K1PB59_9BACT|nr:putative secreted protein [Vulgatibacter incomptus]
MTFRTRIPLGRAGERLRLTFRAGDGPAKVHAVTVASADRTTGGWVALSPVPATFGGLQGFSASPRERVTSDALPFAVAFRQEVWVSFEAEGFLATGENELFPGSVVLPGQHAGDTAIAGDPQERAVGLATIDVEGEPTRGFVAIGDSITEAFVYPAQHPYLQSWPALVEEGLRLPVANAAVSGTGIEEARDALGQEVFPLAGITDCLVMIGTNNLWDHDVQAMSAAYLELYRALEPFCTVWAGTLPPKDAPWVSPQVQARRLATNEWLRHDAPVAHLIDFEAVLRSADDPNEWLPGFTRDGVHPVVPGQQAMAEEALHVIRRALYP